MNLPLYLATILFILFSNTCLANDALIFENIHDFENAMPAQTQLESDSTAFADTNIGTQLAVEPKSDADADETVYTLPSAVPTITAPIETQPSTDTTAEIDDIDATDSNDDSTVNFAEEVVDISPESLEPAELLPLDSTNTQQANTKTISYGSLWDRVAAGFTMPTMHSPYVQSYEKTYSAHPEKFSAIIERSEKYLFHILEEIDKRNMPTEMALIPIIESAYKPGALSRSKALGLWQIMPATGKYFGLKQDWWVDERQNVMEATDVALNYLEKLHTRFGSWDLALAAYNAGGGTVGRAIKKNRAQGKPTDYQHLSLRLETRRYVPKMQAVKNIILNPHLYGINIPHLEDRPYFTTVHAPVQIDTKLVAKLAEISEDEFKSLNPNFKRPVIASPNNAHILLLPVHAADTFEYNLATYDQPLVNWQPYTMHAGETLASVAKSFNINLKSLSKINQLPTYLKVRRKLTILVPNNSRQHQSIARTNDTYVASDISAKQSAKNIHPSVLKSLQNNHKLFATAKSKSSKRKRSVTYVVRSGDTLSRIAKRFRVSINSIVKRNRIKRNRIKIGQRLKI